MTAYIAPGLLAPEEVIAQHWQTTVAEMTDRNRKRHNVEARQVAMWYLITRQKYNYRQAAHVFGRDHATAIHACRQVDDLMQTNKLFRKRVQAVVIRLEKLSPKVNNELN